ncbi:hypothetical protein C7N43_24600 [Sphingobacteriales bacterium UPWRP_1]|nr:hypothetical protein BVG80_16935 [Sphingobacteriales bacterium TSM_CSM]PSJ74333.1 hypothetical protein C7N43_24600 [Sphingobacteriales bacterium UPWRP_1]
MLFQNYLATKSEPESNSVCDRKQIFKNLLALNLDFEAKRESIPQHVWHPFPAKFPPALPDLFIQNLTSPGDMVLDPMAGSCTTLLESMRLNRNAVGFDIDPLSLILGKAKLQNIDKFEAKTIGNELINKAVLLYQTSKTELLDKFNEYYGQETVDFIDYWFEKNTQLELFALILQIESLSNQKLQSFFKLIFSSIIIAKSGGVSLASDLAHTRPHRVMQKRVNSAFVEFGKKMNKIINSNFKPLTGNFDLYEANAKKMPLAASSINLIITSPPYANNAIDYMRAHKFTLIWFKYGITSLKNTRKEYIGSEAYINEYIVPLPLFTISLINTLKKVNNSKGKSLERYYSEMQQVFAEMYRVLKPESACIIVVATSVLNGIDVQIDKCFKEISEQIGFEHIHTAVRNIPRNKRMMPVSNVKNNSQIESRMHQEFVIGLWKN